MFLYVFQRRLYNIYSYVLCLLPSKIMLCYFHYYQHFNRMYCKRTVKIPIRHRNMQYAASDLDLHCLPMPLKKDAMHNGLSIFHILVNNKRRFWECRLDGAFAARICYMLKLSHELAEKIHNNCMQQYNKTCVNDQSKDLNDKW